MVAKMIVIEGSDGTGKATQTAMLVEHLKRDGFGVATMSFPRYNTPTGQKVYDYLHGKLGEATKVDPLVASQLFYEDRKAALPEIKEILKKDDFLIFDRYKYSNLGLQGAKIRDSKKREILIRKLQEMEKEIPDADLVIVLILPVEVSQRLMKREKERDMHETDPDYMKRANETYLWLAKNNKNWIVIDCTKNGKLMTKENIHKIIYQKVMVQFKSTFA